MTHPHWFSLEEIGINKKQALPKACLKSSSNERKSFFLRDAGQLKAIGNAQTKFFVWPNSVKQIWSKKILDGYTVQPEGDSAAMQKK